MSWGNEYGADPAPHNHNALDINAGTLALERGGIENDISAAVRGDIIWWAGPGGAQVYPGDIGCRAYHDVDQAAADSTWTAMALNQERWDTDAIHDLSTNNSRLTCKTAGVYVIDGGMITDFADGPTWVLRIRLNGTTTIRRFSNPMYHHQMALSTVYKLAINDYVELYMTQNTGSSKNARAIPNWSVEFGMQLIART